MHTNPADTACHVGRAAPMGRDERRAAIVAATVPLLREHGHAVTTRQIASASGIGEGTIFRVFSDKAELVAACMDAVTDPAPTLALLREIDPSQPLARRLAAAVEILQDRRRSVFELLIALRFPEAPKDGDHSAHGEHSGHRPPRRHDHTEIIAALADLLRQDSELLRFTPERTARFAILMTFAGTHRKITDDEPLSAEEIVDLLLHGVGKEGRC